MYRNDKVIRRYSEPFKLKILDELTAGKLNKYQLGKAYGIVYFYYFMYLDQPVMLSGNENIPILKAFWADSWLKTILLIFPFIIIQLALIYQVIISPISMKLEEGYE